MKIRFILFLFLFSMQVHAQSVVQTLKDFYKNAQMDCYVDKINKLIIYENEFLYNKWSSQYLENFDLHKEHFIPMLVIRFVNTEKYTYDNNIYDYITIDSARVFTLACIDKKNNVTAFANSYLGIEAYCKVPKSHLNKKLKKVIRGIYKFHPEVILYCHSLATLSYPFNEFMFIKNGKIFVYDVMTEKALELNIYIKEAFGSYCKKLSREVIPRWSLERNDSTRFDFIFRFTYRTTGPTPKDEIFLCH